MKDLYAQLLKTMKELDRFMSPYTLFGMPVYVDKEVPVVRLNYKCRTKYGDEFELLTPGQQAELNLWLEARFGYISNVPQGTAYVFNNSILLNPFDAIRLGMNV
jgi:hypothetical protein